MGHSEHGIYADDYQPLENQEAISLLRNAAKAMNISDPSEMELRAHAATLVKLTEEFPNVDITLREDPASERVFHSSALRFVQYE